MKLNLPLAAKAPAARSHGAPGSGRPLCSAKLIKNSSRPPYEIRNWVKSVILPPFSVGADRHRLVPWWQENDEVADDDDYERDD
jgi:hypothetical protein